MLNKVIGYLNEHHMIEQNDKIIVGVSGGADSICLLSVLIELKQRFGLSLFVVHIEHGIRGIESKQDAEFVKKVATKEVLPYYEFSYDVTALAKEWGMSVEEAGRKVRYDSFQKVFSEVSANKIAVAHNADDNAETVLHNLIRGAGLLGLMGITPQRKTLIRPLLGVSRKEIEHYLEERSIGYRTDSTNLSTDYTRNKIRLQLLPFIEQNLNENAKEHLNQTAKIMAETADYLERQGKRAFYECVTRQDEQLQVSCRIFLAYHTVIQKQVIRICVGELAAGLKDITAKHIQAALELFDRQVGKQIDLPSQILVTKAYETVIFGKKEETLVINENIELEISPPETIIFQGMEFSFRIEPYNTREYIPEKAYTKWFDYDKIKGTLRLRSRKTGDDIIVNSSGGKKKIKNYFIDEKIPKEERDCIPMLADDNHIIWIVGYRISEVYKITGDTKLILKVHVNGGNENGRQN